MPPFDNEQAFQKLVRLLDERNIATLSRAANALGLVGDERAIDKLVELAVTHPNATVVEAALAALGSIGSQHSIEQLIAIARQRPQLRATVLYACSGAQEPEQVRPFILEALHDAAADVRIGAISAATQLAMRDMREPMLSLLRDADADVKTVALAYFATIGSEADIPFLQHVAAHDMSANAADELVAALAEEAIQRIRERARQRGAVW